MRRRESNNITLNGKSKFFHKTAMVLLYPVRKPAIFIPVIILMYLIPTFIGAKPAEVHLWYWNKIKNATSDVSTKIEDTAKKLVKPIEGIKLPEMGGSRVPERGIDQVVDLPVSDNQNIRRQTFEKSKSAPVSVDILEREASVAIVDVEPSDKPYIKAVAKKEAPKVEEVKSEKKLPLIYLENIEVVEGFAMVKSANEIMLQGKEIFLYGIYVDPITSKGVEAETYLKNFISNNTVRCEISAYTYQKVATAICYVKGQNINRTLVDKGYSRNVAL